MLWLNMLGIHLMGYDKIRTSISSTEVVHDKTRRAKVTRTSSIRSSSMPKGAWTKLCMVKFYKTTPCRPREPSTLSMRRSSIKERPPIEVRYA